MPSPVLALPCGSRSSSRTFLSTAARAVAKLIAVVVLPTPPFWLAIAIMRGDGVVSGIRESWAAGARITGDSLQTQDAAGRIGQAGLALKPDMPRFGRVGQFFVNHTPLEEETNRLGAHESLGNRQQLRQWRERPRGDDIGG